ncbi:MAG: hypothetical protein ACLQUY_18690 [Ktedonobacterales bacterium]
MPESAPEPPGSPTNQNTPRTTPPNNMYREMQSEMLLRTGITFFSAISGIACYYGAKAIGFNQTLAAIAGLVFALVVWIAARSLARDFRVEARRRRAEDRDQQP